MQYKIEQNQTSRAEGDNKDWLECTVNALQISVNSIGIEKNLRTALENNIRKNVGQFNLAFETESAGEKLRLNLQFKKDTSGYDFTGYQVTLLHPMSIEHRTLNGIYTGELERKLKATDWYYGIAEKPEEVVKGYKDVESAERDLKQLAQSDEGGLAAVRLWHNHVPANTVPKPDFIAKMETALNLYPERAFASNVKLGDACDIVRGYSKDEPVARATANVRTEFTSHEQQPVAVKQHWQQAGAKTVKAEVPAKEKKHKHRRKLR